MWWQNTSERQNKKNIRLVWKHQSITMAQLESMACCKNIDIYQGMLEGTQDIMGLTKSPNNSGGLWTWHCYVTICTKIFSQLLCLLFSFPLPLPFPWSVSPHTSNQLFSFFPSPTLSIFTQLHQLRWRMSATTIMPFEGTTEDEGRDWTGEGACVMGRGRTKKGAVVLGRLAEELTDRRSAQWNPSMRHFVLFCIKPQRGGTT